MDGSNRPVQRQGTEPPDSESAGPPMVVRARPLTDGARFLRVIGVIDGHTGSQLGQRLIHEARRCTSTPPRVVLDLDQVTFLDRAGLDSLLAAQSRLANGFGTVELSNPGPHVVRMLHEAHLDGESGTPPDRQSTSPYSAPDGPDQQPG